MIPKARKSPLSRSCLILFLPVLFRLDEKTSQENQYCLLYIMPSLHSVSDDQSVSNLCSPNTHSLRRKAEDGNRGHEQNQVVELAIKLVTV